MKEYILNIIKAFAIAIVIAVLSYSLTNVIYQPKEMVKRGYKVDTTDKRSGGIIVIKNIGGVSVGDLPELSGSKKTAVDIAAMIKNADISKGAKVFKKCAACHKIKKGVASITGPNLFGIIGRKRASIAEFAYSDAMRSKGGIWNYEELNQFLIKPKSYIPGTKMAFAGLKKDKDRANVIAYLESVANNNN